MVDLTFKYYSEDYKKTRQHKVFHNLNSQFFFSCFYLVSQFGCHPIQIFLGNSFRKVCFFIWRTIFSLSHKFRIKFSRLFNISYIITFLLLFTDFNIANAGECQGKFVNPITDICWSCIFPISIGPAKVNIGGRRDTENPSSLLCQCMAERSGIQKFLPGIPVGFWEPVRLVDITRTPYCMVGLGGIKFTSSNLKHGTVGRKDGQSGAKHSFYQAHWYIYPVVYWLELLTDFMCLEQASMDIGYITELDPMWNNDELAFIINPEAVLFSNPIAQASCGLDCTSATVDFPQNKLFWCGGCQGSLYPFTGNITNHYSGVQASQLITQKIIAKLHRQLTLWETSGEDALCEKKIAPKIKKDQYKLQMTYPIPDATGAYSCNPLGHTTTLTESGKEFPYKGEDFGYLIWRKRNCCA